MDDEITTYGDVNVVTFSGSYEIGDGVREAAATAGKHVLCKMDGKNPMIAADTADLDLAVDLTIAGGLSGLLGQPVRRRAEW